MRQFLVFNGLRSADGVVFQVYVRASTHHEAIEIARKAFRWQREHFGFHPSFDENLTAICVEATA